MTDRSSFRMTQGFDVLVPKASQAYPIPCDEWDFLKSKLKPLTEAPWLFHIIGSALIGAGLSTLISILLGAFTGEERFRALVLAGAVVAVTFICGGLCLFFGARQRQDRRVSAEDVFRQMEIIEARYERPG